MQFLENQVKRFFQENYKKGDFYWQGGGWTFGSQILIKLCEAVPSMLNKNPQV